MTIISGPLSACSKVLLFGTTTLMAYHHPTTSNALLVLLSPEPHSHLQSELEVIEPHCPILTSCHNVHGCSCSRVNANIVRTWPVLRVSGAFIVYRWAATTDSAHMCNRSVTEFQHLELEQRARNRISLDWLIACLVSQVSGLVFRFEILASDTP